MPLKNVKEEIKGYLQSPKTPTFILKSGRATSTRKKKMNQKQFEAIYETQRYCKLDLYEFRSSRDVSVKMSLSYMVCLSSFSELRNNNQNSSKGK